VPGGVLTGLLRLLRVLGGSVPEIVVLMLMPAPSLRVRPGTMNALARPADQIADGLQRLAVALV
jgi:hypothetical protein